jgi:hypothetical protein
MYMHVAFQYGKRTWGLEPMYGVYLSMALLAAVV